MAKETVAVVVREDLDAVSAAVVGERLVDAALSTPGSRCIVVDIRQVPFVDSCGLYALVRARNRLAEHGVECVFVAAEDSLARRLLGITELDAVLSVHVRMGDAVEAARRCVSA